MRFYKINNLLRGAGLGGSRRRSGWEIYLEKLEKGKVSLNGQIIELPIAKLTLANYQDSGFELVEVD